MIRTQVSLEADVYRRAKAEAARLGISLAELFRRALERTLGERPPRGQKPWMRYSGCINGGPAESVNERIDAVVYGRER